MPAKDARIDAYIDKAADFAKPILRHLRNLAHEAAPQLEETIKWSFPHFLHKGIVCSMAAFKNHCSLGFWKRRLLLEKIGGRKPKGSGMGLFGKIMSLADLPKYAELKAYIRKAVRLI